MAVRRTSARPPEERANLRINARAARRRIAEKGMAERAGSKIKSRG